MSKDDDDRRHSKPVQTPEHRELTDEERAPIEAENAFRQFDRLIEIVEESLNEIRNGGNPIPVKPSVLMELNRLAVEKIIANPGGYVRRRWKSASRNTSRRGGRTCPSTSTRCASMFSATGIAQRCI